jgi:hypothetical protein
MAKCARTHSESGSFCKIHRLGSCFVRVDQPVRCASPKDRKSGRPRQLAERLVVVAAERAAPAAVETADQMWDRGLCVIIRRIAQGARQ